MSKRKPEKPLMPFDRRHVENQRWMPVEGASGYLISDYGVLVRLPKESHLPNGGKCMKPKKFVTPIILKGYVRYNLLFNDGRMIQKSAHRLVGAAFIPNPENKPQINHINGIKNDNRVGNLEWATASENVKHGYDIGVSSNKNALAAFLLVAQKPVLNTETGIFYDSARYAAETRGITRKALINMLNGYQKNKTSFIYV